MNDLFLLHVGTNRAECLKPGQHSRRRVLEGLQYPFAVTGFGKNLYYTDWKTYVTATYKAGAASPSVSGCRPLGLAIRPVKIPLLPHPSGCQGTDREGGEEGS